jgi:hypothetical protein
MKGSIRSNAACFCPDRGAFVKYIANCFICPASQNSIDGKVAPALRPVTAPVCIGLARTYFCASVDVDSCARPRSA